MAHRVQLSLQILDDNLYNGLIEDLKANRELNNKVIDVLTAYYYNEEIRNTIEKYIKGDSIDETYNTSTNTDELFADIHNAMAMSNFYANEAMQTLEDGTDMVDDILNQTSKQAEEDGIIDNVSTSEYGYEIPKLLTTIDEKKVQKVAKKVQERVNTTNEKKVSDNEQFLEKVVLKLCEMVGLDPSSVVDTKSELYANTENSDKNTDNSEKEVKLSDNLKEEEQVKLVRPEPEKPIVKEQKVEVKESNNSQEQRVDETQSTPIKEVVTKKEVIEEDNLDGFSSLLESLDSLDF